MTGRIRSYVQRRPHHECFAPKSASRFEYPCKWVKGEFELDVPKRVPNTPPPDSVAPVKIPRQVVGSWIFGGNAIPTFGTRRSEKAHSRPLPARGGRLTLSD